jgi:flagellar motor switch protein FliM
LDVNQDWSHDHRWHSVMSPETTVGDWHLEVCPELCCVMVDKMLGGNPEAGATFTRHMTEIELRLMGRVVEQTLETIEEAWRRVSEVHWVARHNEKRPSGKPMHEAAVQIRFEVALCENSGSIRLSIPRPTIEALQPCLGDLARSIHSGDAVKQRHAHNVASAPIDVVANVAHSTIHSTDLLELNVGDVIATEKRVDEPLELTIHNVPKFIIRAGSLRGNKAVQIENAIDPPPDAPASSNTDPSRES